MIGLVTIENDLYASPISLILIKVDDAYREFHRQIMSSIKNRVLSPANRLLIF